MAIVHLGAKRLQGTKLDRVNDSLGSSADGTNSGITLLTGAETLKGTPDLTENFGDSSSHSSDGTTVNGWYSSDSDKTFYDGTNNYGRFDFHGELILHYRLIYNNQVMVVLALQLIQQSGL